MSTHTYVCIHTPTYIQGDISFKDWHVPLGEVPSPKSTGQPGAGNSSRSEKPGKHWKIPAGWCDGTPAL